MRTVPGSGPADRDFPTTYENEEGEMVHGDAEQLVKPGTSGFVRAFVDELPSPFDCDPESLDDLPVLDP